MIRKLTWVVLAAVAASLGVPARTSPVGGDRSDPEPPELRYAVRSSPAPLAVPGKGALVLEIEVPTRFHIFSDETLALEMPALKGVVWGKAKVPQGKMEEDRPVLRGTVRVEVPVELTANAGAPTAANGSTYLYVTSAGYPGDRGDYQGHVTAINLANGTQHVFNTMCSDQPVHFMYAPNPPSCNGVQSAIWARAGVVYLSATNKIYMATGNGTFNPSQHYWGDTVFSLNPDATGLGGNPLKTYTPVNYQALQNSDTDIGSTNIAVLPTAITSTVQHLGLQGGKDSIVRLIDLDQMSSSSPGLIGGDVFSTTMPQGGEILTAPAVWINPSDHTTWVFVSTNNGLAAFQVTYTTGNVPHLTSKWHTSTGGTSPIIANNVLYYASSGNMLALDPLTSKTLWKDNSFMGGVHWESPIIVNGVLYITDQNSHLNAYTLP